MPKLKLELDIIPDVKSGKVKPGVADIKKMFAEIEGLELIDADKLEAELRSAAGAVEGLEDALGDAAALGKQIEANIRKLSPEDIDQLATAFESTAKSQQVLVNKLKAARAQLAITGKQGSDDWKKIDAQIGEAEEQLEMFQQALKETKEISADGGGVLEKMFAFEGIAKAGEFLSNIAEKSAEARLEMTKLANASDATGAELSVLKESANDVLRAVGGSVAEARAALTATTTALKGVVPKEELEDAAIFGAKFQKQWDKDVNETLGKGAPFIQNFGLKGKEAFDLIALGQRDAMTADDDFLDTIKEYSGQFEEAGFSAQEFIGTLIKGRESGAFNLDKVADGVKESTIRIKSAGNDVAVALAEVSGAPAELKTKLETALEGVRSGQVSIKDFFQVTAKDIQGAMDSGVISSSVKKQLEIAIGGTPFEDLGEGMYTKIFAAPIDAKQIQAKATQAGSALQSGFGSVNVFESLGNEIEIFTTSAAETFAPFISGAGGVLTTITQIGPGLSLLQDKFGVFSVAGDLVKKLVPRLFAVVPAIGAQAVATGGAETAQIGLNLAMLANPAFLLVAGIGAVVAAFLIFGDSTKEIGEAMDDVNAKMEDFNEAQAQAQAAKETGASLKALANEYDNLSSKTDPASQKRFQEVAAELAAKAPDYAESVEVLGESGEVVGQKFVIATDSVREFAAANEAMAAEAAADQLEALQSEAAALVESYRESSDTLDELKAKRVDLKTDTAEEANLRALSGEAGLQELGILDDQREKQADINKEISEESKKRVEAQKTILKAVKLLQDQGKSQAEIAQTLGLTTEEAKKFAPEIKKGGDAAKGATTAVAGLQAGTARAKQTAQDLAAAWDKAKQSIDAAYDNSFKAVLQLKQEQRAAAAELKRLKDQEAKASPDSTVLALTKEQQLRKAFLEQRVKDIPKEIADEFNAAKAALKDQRQIELESSKLELQIGKISLSENDFQKRAREIRKEIGETFFEIANENEKDLVKQVIDKIDKDLSTALGDIDKEIEERRKAAAESRRDTNAANDISSKDEISVINALNSMKKALRAKADNDRLNAEKEVHKKILDEFAKFLAEENSLLTAALNAQVDELNRQADAIIGNDDDALTERLSKRRQALAIQQALELKALVESNEGYLSTYGELQIALRDGDEATAAEGKRQAQEKAAALRKSLGDQEKQIIENNTEALAIQQKFGAAFTKLDGETLSERYEREQKVLDEALARQLAAVARANEERLRIVEDIATFASTIGGAAIDADVEKQIEELEKQHAEILDSEETFEAEKERIQQEGEDKRAAIEARARAIRIEADRQAALEELAVQRDALKEKLKLAQESGKVEEAKDIGKQLDAVGKEIESKGSILTGIAGDLQSNITGVVTNLFQGDADAVKAPFRSAFQSLAGVLQQLATTKVTEVVLGSINGLTGIPGLLLSFAAKPAISALINSILSPILNSLLSFSTGGRVDGPTLALLGDIPSGARNREWVLRDDQLKQIMLDAASAGQGALVGEMRAVRAGIESMAGREWRLKGADIVGATTRTARAQSRRIINPSRAMK